ncbi:MAG: hypothetical protein QM790_16800 [Nibricoccus sp.]
MKGTITANQIRPGKNKTIKGVSGSGKPQLRFAAQSDVAHCTHCGHPKHVRQDSEIALPDDFNSWCAGQVEKLLAAAGQGALETTSSDIRGHNLRASASLPGIGGITGLSGKLVVGRNTAWCWLHEDRDMPLVAALKWAWVVGVDATELFSKKLTVDELVYRPLPDPIKVRKKKTRNASVPPNSTLLYLTALKLAATNPFIAPRVDELVKQSGVHLKHPAFKDPQFVRLMQRLRNHERNFLHKERVWREVLDVHNAALKVIARGSRVTRRRVGSEMTKPGCFCGPLARAYLKWFKKRTQNAKLPLGPKRIPVDVRAYWDLVRHSETTKGS